MNVAQQVYLRAESDAVQYARNATTVVVRDADDAVATVIQIVSPGDKGRSPVNHATARYEPFANTQ